MSLRCDIKLCHIQKFADDMSFVGCMRDAVEEGYRSPMRDFVMPNQQPAAQHI